jgi:hypothetical protein
MVLVPCSMKALATMASVTVKSCLPALLRSSAQGGAPGQADPPVLQEQEPVGAYQERSPLGVLI